MRVGKSLLMIMMSIGISFMSMAQDDDQDLQGRVQYEKKESEPTVKSSPSKPEVVEGEMEMTSSMTRLFENNLADPEQEVEVLRVIEDKAFIKSLAGQNDMPEDFEYKDDKFVLKYKRSGDEEKIKAEGDPSEFVAKYNAFRQNQGITPAEEAPVTKDESLYAEPIEVNTSTRGVDANTRARNYEPEQTNITRIGVPMESEEACPMNNPTMIQKQMKMRRSCPGNSMNKNKGSSSTEEYHYNSSGSDMKTKGEKYKSN